MTDLPDRPNAQGRITRAILGIWLACSLAVADGPPGRNHRLQYRSPIPLGVSGFNLKECSAGTLGSLVVRTRPHFFPFILSNNHVLARINEGRPGERIVQRARGDTEPECSTNGVIVVAGLSLFRRIKFDGSDNEIDAAIAGIVPGRVRPSGFILDVGSPSNLTIGPRLGLGVKKSGRTTGLTRGRITAVDATLMITYPPGVAKFVHQIVARPTPGSPLVCRPGDSGSLMVTDDERHPNPVGLVFAGDEAARECFANPIRAVLSAFDVGFPIPPRATEEEANSEQEQESVEAPETESAVASISLIKDRYDDYLLGLPEVVGTAVGYAADGSGRVVIKLLLRKITSEAAQAVPAELEGVPVEVEETGEFRPL